MRKNLFQSVKTRAVAVGTLLMVSAGTALAGGGGGVDTSSITAEMVAYGAAVVVLAIAFATVLWTKRGANLLRP
ncbi:MULTISPECIES: hypothetical protein [unclassified Pseudoxanthomonas]|uniref:hypothetical protein n=1 Tax=unclassified Pseudoxanthomonas TaxID=2645906 RepID=UPI00307D6405